MGEGFETEVEGKKSHVLLEQGRECSLYLRLFFRKSKTDKEQCLGGYRRGQKRKEKE